MAKTRWTAADVERVQRKMAGEVPVKPKKLANAPVIPKSDPIGLTHIKSVLKRKGIPFEVEWKFLTKRKFKFDLAILNFKCAIEYEGLMSKKSRHTTLTGYSKDCEKYNLAVINGWHVLRYTAMNYKDFESNLIEFLLNYNYNN